MIVPLSLLACLVLAGCQSCTPTPIPSPIPTPVPAPVVDAGPNPPPAPAADAAPGPVPTSCSDFENGLGPALVCVGFETKQTPGALLVTIDAVCASKGIAAARNKLTALDVQHKCADKIGAGK